MDNELTGTKYIDAHRVRVYKDGSYQNILDLISSPQGIATTVQGGSGMNVTETATRQYLIENTAQGETGQPGADSAFQTITVNNGIADHTYDSNTVSGVRFTGSAIRSLSNGVLTISELQGPAGQNGSTPQDGNDGKDAAMQQIRVGSTVYNSDSLTEVVFSSANATLVNGVLTLDSMKGVMVMMGTTARWRLSL